MSHNLTAQQRLDKLAEQGIKHQPRAWMATIRRGNSVQVMFARKVRADVEITFSDNTIVGDKVEVTNNQVFIMSPKVMKQTNMASDLVLSYFEQEGSKFKKLMAMTKWNDWLTA